MAVRPRVMYAVRPLTTRLALLRRELGRSQGSLAEAVQCSKSILGQLERGAVVVNEGSPLANRLARFFRMPFPQLMEQVPDPLWRDIDTPDISATR